MGILSTVLVLLLSSSLMLLSSCLRPMGTLGPLISRPWWNNLRSCQHNVLSFSVRQSRTDGTTTYRPETDGSADAVGVPLLQVLCRRARAERPDDNRHERGSSGSNLLSLCSSRCSNLPCDAPRTIRNGSECNLVKSTSFCERE